jgi:hypothetical protein
MPPSMSARRDPAGAANAREAVMRREDGLLDRHRNHGIDSKKMRQESLSVSLRRNEDVCHS